MVNGWAERPSCLRTSHSDAKLTTGRVIPTFVLSLNPFENPPARTKTEAEVSLKKVTSLAGYVEGETHDVPSMDVVKMSEPMDDDVGVDESDDMLVPRFCTSMANLGRPLESTMSVGTCRSYSTSIIRVFKGWVKNVDAISDIYLNILK